MEDLLYPGTTFLVQITSWPDARSGALVFLKTRLFCGVKKASTLNHFSTFFIIENSFKIFRFIKRRIVLYHQRFIIMHLFLSSHHSFGTAIWIWPIHREFMIVRHVLTTMGQQVVNRKIQHKYKNGINLSHGVYTF